MASRLTALLASLMLAAALHVIAIDASQNGCTTIKPGPDWVCAHGGWWPPGMPIPGVTPPPTPPPPPPDETSCPSVQPGPGWICAHGGWWPPGMPIPGGPPPPPLPQPGGCTTVRPGPDWVCAHGGWWPPGMPIPGGAPPPPSDCQYSVSPVERITMPLGESNVVLVETADHCAWTVQPGADWLSLSSPPGGIGTGLISYIAHQNTESFTSSFREAPLMVRWETETAGQNVWIRQMPRCAMIVMSPPGTTPVVTAAPNNGEFFIQVPAAGGYFPLWTLVDPPFSCPWSVRSQAEWIDIEYPILPTFYRGDGGFAFFVDANSTGVTRIGKIEVGEKFLTITQHPQ